MVAVVDRKLLRIENEILNLSHFASYLLDSIQIRSEAAFFHVILSLSHYGRRSRAGEFELNYCAASFAMVCCSVIPPSISKSALMKAG